jgi:hypothetical protein
MSMVSRSGLAFAVVVMLGLATLGGCGGSDTGTNGAGLTFGNLRVEEIGSQRAVIRFTTSQPASCEAEYGLSAEALSQRATDPMMAPGQLVMEHRVPLEDLTPATSYFMRARATDGAGRTFRSEIMQFTTLPESPAPELVNVALRGAGTAVTEVSSNFGHGDDDSTWGAHKAIDGLMSTEWATHGDGDGAFLALDLGASRTIYRFGFRSRQMSDGSSIITRVRVIVEETGAVLGVFDTPDPAQTYLFDLPTPVAARMLRVETVTTTGGNTGAREIQFFAAAR